MNDSTKDMLRRTMKAITEVTPEAPGIETVSRRSAPKRPLASNGGSPRGWRGPATALVAAAVVLVLVGVGALGTHWLRSSVPVFSVASESIVGAGNEGWVVVGFLKHDSDVNATTVLSALAARPGVIAVRYVTQAEAQAEALEMFKVAGDEALVRVLEENPDLIPADVRVLVHSFERAQTIEAEFAEMRGIESVHLYFGTLDELSWLPEPMDSTQGDEAHGDEAWVSDTTTTSVATGTTPVGDLDTLSDLSAFVFQPLIQDPVVVFLSSDLDDDQRDKFVEITGMDGGNVGVSLRETLAIVARERLAQDDEALALLDEYPEIVEALIWSVMNDPTADRQRMVDAFLAMSMSSVAAVQSSAGVRTIAESDLPDDALRLRSWWRAQMYRETQLAWHDKSIVADGELRAFLAGLTPLEREAASLDQWRQTAQQACTNTPFTTVFGMGSHTLRERLQETICRELIPWREQPSD